jgi:3-ketosteroid 9alpha-monooxygenase subunit B
MTSARYHRLTVQAVTDETSDARSITLAVPEGLQESFRYRPGQFLTLRLAVEGRHLPRCYSMSSTPGLDDALRVTVKRVAAGGAPTGCATTCGPSDSLEVMAPAGMFRLPGWRATSSWRRGGAGSPRCFRSCVPRWPRAAGRIRLLYANRDEGSVIFRDALKARWPRAPSRCR